jgi:hypothetical protein
MAYVSQELKAKLSPMIKSICKNYGVKASLAVSNHSTLVLNIKSGSIDFFKSYNRDLDKPENGNIRVNPYWYNDHFDGAAKEFLSEVITAMNEGNFDKSDSQTDYFHVGWYVNVNIGQWDKPYELVL